MVVMLVLIVVMEKLLIQVIAKRRTMTMIWAVKVEHNPLRLTHPHLIS